MRSISDALRERELQMEKLKMEIEKLREVARILEDADAKPAPVGVPVPSKRWP